MNGALVALLLLVLAFSAREGNGDMEQDMKALGSFKAELLASNPSALPDWKPKESSNPCSWSGITCSATGVTGIDLSNMELAGPIPQLGTMASLEKLWLASNRFNGSADVNRTGCPRLKSLNLSSNALSGSIPSIAGIQELDLSHNNLTGWVSASIFSISSCSALVSLNLSHNAFSGPIPSTIGNCTKLESLILDANQLGDPFPRELGAISTLQHLSLAKNHYTEIPDAVFRPGCSLRTLDLSDNNLTALPADISQCSSSLLVLALSENRLTSLPDEIGLLSELQSLTVSDNELAALPAALSNCSKLKVLAASQNQLSNEAVLRTAIQGLGGLIYLVLHSNSFRGVNGVPQWLINGSFPLVHLDLSNNPLGGELPTNIVSSLELLLLSNCSFTGTIPREIANLHKLQVLDLSFNALVGGIPPELGSLKNLLWLMLEGNSLSGSIPQELGNCSSLLWLNVGTNKLTGSIPEELETMGSNASATFAANAPAAAAAAFLVPPDISKCAALQRWLPDNDYPPFSLMSQVLDRERCHTFWSLLFRGDFLFQVCPSVSRNRTRGYVQLSRNNLTGSIPPRIGAAAGLNLLFLYQNNLTGTIPPELSNLALSVLNLSSNSLSGSIPRELGYIHCLQSLDLSSNDLQGIIPNELQLLTSLSRFNISHNPGLRGPIPSGQQFQTFTQESYIGNDGLCFNPSPSGIKHSPPGMPLCGEELSSPPEAQHRAYGGSMIVGVTLTCVLAAGCVALAAIFIRRPFPGRHGYGASRSKEKEDETAPSPPSSSSSSAFKISFQYYGGGGGGGISLFTLDLPKRLTYRDLVSATGDFCEASVIGAGGFGIVHKAKLGDGTMVAIKRLVREGPAGDREFLAEMDTLGHILHPNLVPLLGHSSSGGQKLLVYRYMENGSLEDWLHQPRMGGARAGHLTWPDRLRVAVGTARGLWFLHHGCMPPIIHRDMKASNILLDATMVPRLTDFGLARVMGAQEETHVSTVVAGTLGYVPPEYCQTWRATVKGDVYSFGVVMLELITGQRPVLEEDNRHRQGRRDRECCWSLVDLVNACVAEGAVKEIIDPVVGCADLEHAEKFLQLAIDCTQNVPVRRPSMTDVLLRLEEMAAAAGVLDLNGGNILTT